MSRHDEFEWVKNVYMPALIAAKGDNQTLVDLGHHNLYFMNALLNHLDSLNYSYAIVRIRRNRYEVALSLLFTETHSPKSENPCNTLLFRLCPFDRVEDVILHPPNKYIWNKFTAFQKALWMIDEVEARWDLIKKRNKLHPFHILEVYWGKAYPGSIEDAIAKVAKLIGMNVNLHSGAVPNLKLHVGNKTKSEFNSLNAWKQDVAYMRQMKYSYIPG
jgi:hypothetical protein